MLISTEDTKKNTCICVLQVDDTTFISSFPLFPPLKATFIASLAQTPHTCENNAYIVMNKNKSKNKQVFCKMKQQQKQ